MSKTDQRGRSKSKGSFVKLPFDMLDSPAFLALPPEAKALYVHIAHRYTGSNNGQISFSCREAAKLLKVGKDTAAAMFRELEEKGFIRLAQDSSFSLKLKLARCWTLTQWPLKPGVAPTNDWRFWNTAPATAPQNARNTSDMGARNRFDAEEVKCSG